MEPITEPNMESTSTPTTAPPQKPKRPRLRKSKSKAISTESLPNPLVLFDQQHSNEGKEILIGIDEAGAGCLAGPVTVAACYIPSHVVIKGINDSKKLSAKRREEIADQLIAHPDVWYAVIHVNQRRIEEINILQCRFEGFTKAYEDLSEHLKGGNILTPHRVLIDGDKVPKFFKENRITTEAIVKGDSKSYSIAAASILAKVSRDRLMCEYDKMYPQYGFAQHKGYPNPAHKRIIQQVGPCPLHRITFSGVKEHIEWMNG